MSEKEAPPPEAQLAAFLTKFTPEVAARAEEILVRLRARLPHALELVYDNYNALAIGFGPSERAGEAILSIAVYPRWVSLFFLQAKDLPDPGHLLKGQGNVARHIVLPSASAVEDPAIQRLIGEALMRAKVKLSETTAHRIVVRSVSRKQRPRRPPEAGPKPLPRPASTKG